MQRRVITTIESDVKRMSPAIKRMALKASTVTLSGKSYEYIRNNIINLTKELLVHSFQLTELSKRKTINVTDIYYAAKVLNYPNPIYDLSQITKCTISPHVQKKAKIRFYQKQVDCTYFQQAVFKRIIKNVWENTEPLLMTKESKLAIQLLVESRLITLLQGASLAIIHRKGKKLQNNNIKLTETLAQLKI